AILIRPAVDRLRPVGLTAMADAFIELQTAPEAGELSREDWLGLLVDREATSRENKRLARRLRQARLRQSAVVEDVDFRAHRGLDRALFLKLASCECLCRLDRHHPSYATCIRVDGADRCDPHADPIGRATA